MTSLLRQRALSRSRPTFGPLRFIEALPWIVLAAALRVIAFSGGPVALFAVIGASIAILQAFIAVARRSIELADGQTDLGSLTLKDEIRLSLRILGLIALLMAIGVVSMIWTGNAGLSGSMIAGLDGMAFDQFTHLGKFWSATVAALVLLMLLHAERHAGRINLLDVIAELIDRWRWLGGAIVVLGGFYFGLSMIQGVVRNAIWAIWQGETSQTFLRNLVFFVFIFSFAMLRLWMTLTVLTWGLRQSYWRAQD